MNKITPNLLERENVEKQTYFYHHIDVITYWSSTLAILEIGS